MTNFNTPPKPEILPAESHSEDFEMANLVGVLDILVQMDLALNDYAHQHTDKSEAQTGEKA